ncbi:hypothetical protein [Brevibacillus marinus]|uniref:hypothetical protein n=1 Tax=Brevibacillus marinus TaxID=2496837 RepID=UPI0019D20450|nr:hypothetical protein [Brevibacillus marinus]
MTFSNAVLAEDGKSAVVTVAGAQFEKSYQITVTGVGEEDYTTTVTFGTVNDYYSLVFTFDAEDTNGNEIPDIEATGATTIQVTAQVVDAEGNPVTDAEGVIRFATTRGGIAQPEKTLQNGQASVQLTSESSLTETVYANVSATIVGDYALEGLTDNTLVEFVPPGGNQDPDEAVPVVKVESNQADRFYVTLGQPKPGLTQEQLQAIADAITVTDGIAGNNPAVLNVRQISNQVLEVLLDTETDETNILTDNAKHEVDFAAVDGIIEATPDQQFTLTDTTKQFVLDVDSVDQRTLVVKYAEAVSWDTDGTLEAHEANNPDNYVINGDPLTDANTSFELSADRKTVTIHLGPADILSASDDNLEVKNVGDWAGVTDPNNRISTQRIEYPVNIDDSIPEITVVRQSPEQFVIELSKPVKLDTTVAATLEEAIAVRYGQDTDQDGLRDVVFDTDGATAGTQGITFAAYDGDLDTLVADPTSDYFDRILLELDADWTVEDGTGTGTGLASHWVDANPLQFVIPAGAFESEVFTTNVEFKEDVANDRDRVSPDVVEFEQDTDANGDLLGTATVKMSEPIQLVGLTGPNTTPNPEQTALNGDVQAGEIVFEKDGVVVQGEVTSVSDDDYTFVIQANDGTNTGFDALRAATPNAAGTWTVSITGISDDYGNTMDTQEFEFEVPALENEEPMEVEPEVLYAEYTYNSDYDGTGTGYDVIRVKFTEVMSNSGASAVGDTSNYVLNGDTLADLGSSIRKGISGVTEDWDGITILLPKDTIGPNANFVLTVASNLKSKDGEKLIGENELNLVDQGGTSFYTAEELVAGWDSTIVSGVVNDDGNDELNDAGDTITITFSDLVNAADVEQVTVNGIVIAATDLTIDDTTNEEIVIDMEGYGVSYDSGDRIEVKVNGQTVFVEVK